MQAHFSITDDAPRELTIEIEDWSSIDILDAFHRATPKVTAATYLHYSPHADLAVIIVKNVIRAIVTPAD